MVNDEAKIQVDDEAMIQEILAKFHKLPKSQYRDELFARILDSLLRTIDVFRDEILKDPITDDFAD